MRQPTPAQRPAAVVRPGEEWWKQAPIVQQSQQAAPMPAPEQAMPQPSAQWWEQAPLANPEPQAATPQAQAPAQRGVMERFVDPAINAVTGAVNYVQGAIKGKHDPLYKDVPQLEKNSGIIMDGVADTSAVTDAAYADVWKKTLQDEGRYIETVTDENGYKLIKFKGRDGKPDIGYVNKPGLDWKDVNRGVSAALPYTLAGGTVGRALGLFGATGTVTNVAGQALGAAATSGAQDVAAYQIGSKQDLDINRMAFAAGLGGAGELVGRVVGPFIRRLVGDQSLVTPEGVLTPKGIALAKKQGFDPKLIDQDLALEFKRLAEGAADPAEALIKAQADRFGIPTTKGQRINDRQMLITEKDARYGTLGDRPKEIMKNLDESQQKAIEGAALGGSDVPQTSRNAIAPHLAPKRGVADQRLDVMGTGAQDGLNAAKKRIKELEDAAWKNTENIAPRSNATESIPDFVQKALGVRRIKPELTPTAAQMRTELKAFMSGKALQSSDDEIFGQNAITYVDEMRRVLMTYKTGAVPGSADDAAAKAIYKGFDDWMVHAAENNLLTGGPGAAQALLNARRTTAELRGVLKPLVDGKKTNAARILEKVGNAQTGEEVLTALLGSSSPKGKFQQGGVDAIKRFKAATTQLGGDVGKQAWNDVRLAYWLKMVAGKNGEILPRGTLITSIKDSFATNPSLMNALYSPKEQTMMKQFMAAVKKASPPDPNASNSGAAVRGLFPKLVQDQLQVAASRNRLASTASGSAYKRFMAGIYRALSRVVPDVLDGKNILGTAAIRGATSQAVTPKAPPSLAGYATAFSPSGSNDSRDPRNQRTR